MSQGETRFSGPNPRLGAEWHGWLPSCQLWSARRRISSSSPPGVVDHRRHGRRSGDLRSRGARARAAHRLTRRDTPGGQPDPGSPPTVLSAAGVPPTPVPPARPDSAADGATGRRPGDIEGGRRPGGGPWATTTATMTSGITASPSENNSRGGQQHRRHGQRQHDDAHAPIPMATPATIGSPGRCDMATPPAAPMTSTGTPDRRGRHSSTARTPGTCTAAAGAARRPSTALFCSNGLIASCPGEEHVRRVVCGRRGVEGRQTRHREPDHRADDQPAAPDPGTQQERSRRTPRSTGAATSPMSRA